MNLVVKWLIPALFFLAVCSGNQQIARAELSSVNVAECIENPELCEQEQPEDTQRSNEDKEAEAAQVGIGFLDIVRMVGALVLVVALLYFLLRLISKKSRSYQENSTVRHLGGTALGGSKSVQVVKVGEHILILGVGEDVALLKEISDPAEQSEMLRKYEEQADMAIQPIDLLKKVTSKVSGQTPPKETGEFKQELEKKMAEFKKSRGQVIQDLKNRERDQNE